MLLALLLLGMAAQHVRADAGAELGLRALRIYTGSSTSCQRAACSLLTAVSRSMASRGGLGRKQQANSAIEGCRWSAACLHGDHWQRQCAGALDAISSRFCLESADAAGPANRYWAEAMGCRVRGRTWGLLLLRALAKTRVQRGCGAPEAAQVRRQWRAAAWAAQ